MLTRLTINLLRIYKLGVSPYMPGQCAYMPTCSEYAVEAVQTKGALKGAWLTFKRLARCHPFSDGGYDPVPSVYEYEK